MALQAKLLSVGVDTLKVNVKLKEQVQVLPINVKILCSYWQQQAREQSKQVATTITFHNARMTMLPNGAPAWKYLVKNDCLQVSMGARLRMPMVAKVTLSSAYLWEMGNVHDALDEVHGFLIDLFGLHFSLQGAQIDLCVDLVGLTLPVEWEQVFISHAIGKRPIGESQKDRAFYRGRKLETITFSGHGSPVSCKLYNKTAEIKQRSPGKAWFYDRWLAKKRADGTAVWDGKAPVWRVEFSLERAGLHEMQLEDKSLSQFINSSWSHNEKCTSYTLWFTAFSLLRSFLDIG